MVGIEPTSSAYQALILPLNYKGTSTSNLGPAGRIELPYPRYEGGVLPLYYTGANLDDRAGIAPAMTGFADQRLAVLATDRWCGVPESNRCLGVGNAAYLPLYEPSTGAGAETRTRFSGLEAQGTSYIPRQHNNIGRGTGTCTQNARFWRPAVCLSLLPCGGMHGTRTR